MHVFVEIRTGIVTVSPFLAEVERNLAWLTAIIAGGGGFAATLIQRARERANQLAEVARESAESDARERLLAEENSLREREFHADLRLCHDRDHPKDVRRPQSLGQSG